MGKLKEAMGEQAPEWLGTARAGEGVVLQWLRDLPEWWPQICP